MANLTVALRNNGSYENNFTEPLTEFNARYAAALLPLTVTFGILGFVGILGNALVIVAYGFGQEFKDKKYRCYVLCLAVIDFVTCLTLIPAEIIKHRSYFNFVETDLCKVKCFFNVFAASSASFCLFVVALDRYILTCHPFLCVKIRSFSHGVAWRLCILNCFLGLIISIPAAMMCGTTSKKMTNASGGETRVYICESEPYYEKLMVRYVYRYTLIVLQTLISIIVICLYVRIGLAIKKVMKMRSNPCDNDIFELRRSSAGDTYVACNTSSHFHQPPLPLNIRILFLVTVVFIVTYFCYIGMTWVDQTKLSPTKFVFFALFIRIYFIHSVINPFLYAKMDSQFRKRCMELLHCKD